MASLAIFMAAASLARANQLRRVTLTGEDIDSWCYLSEIMWPPVVRIVNTPSAARGGVLVGILGKDGQVYIVHCVEGDADVIVLSLKYSMHVV